jgi:hypothetical protein
LKIQFDARVSPLLSQQGFPELVELGKRFFLLGNPRGVQIFGARARIRGGLFRQLPQIIPDRGDTLVQLGQRQSTHRRISSRASSDPTRIDASFVLKGVAEDGQGRAGPGIVIATQAWPRCVFFPQFMARNALFPAAHSEVKSLGRQVGPRLSFKPVRAYILK